MRFDREADLDAIFRRYLERPRRRRLARLVDASYRFVWSTALRVTGNRADAADIAQDVFLKLLLHPPGVDQVSSPRGFLAWEVLGRAASLRRAAERREAREQIAAGRAAEEGLPTADLEELRARVGELPDELRTTVELRYFAGLRNGEVAGLTGVGERNVEKRLERARELLRSRIGKIVPLIALLDGADSGECPIRSSCEPPPGLRAELLKIVASGAAIAVPLAKAAASAGGMTLAKVGASSTLAAAIILCGWGARLVFAPSGKDLGDRAPPPLARSAAPAKTAVSRVVAAPEAPDPSSPADLGSVRGTVWDEEGAPVAGVRVTLGRVITEGEGANPQGRGSPDAPPAARSKAGPVDRETLTGETGEYSFESLEPVKVTIDVEKSPYLPNWVHRVRIKSGEVRKCDFVLCLPLRLYGTVRTPDGEAVKEAQVYISFDFAKHYFADPCDPGPDTDYPFPVDGEGRYDTGFGIVNFRHFCELSGYVLAPGREMRTFRVTCHDFKEREARLDLVLATERRLSVLVLEPAGGPVPGAEVHAGGLAIHRPLTNAEGRAALDRLSAEHFTIGVSKEGYGSESIESAAIDSPELRVVLKPLGPGIEGRITFDEGLPVANRIVSEVYFYELNDQDRPLRAVHEVRLDDKTMTFASHPRGPLRFEALCILGWRTLGRKPLFYDGRNLLRVDFHVSLDPPYLSGRVVRGETGEPLSGAPVKLRLPWRDKGTESFWGTYRILNGLSFPLLPCNLSNTVTAADGSFLFLLCATDRYRPGSPLPVRAILSAGSDEIGRSAELELDLDVGATTVVEDLEIEVEAFGAIEGRALDESGKPLPGAQVAAYDGFDVVKHAKANINAEYRIEGLRPGQYLLQFLGRGPDVKEGTGLGGGTPVGLPPPAEFFDRPIRVEGGRASRWDLDLRQNGLGAIDGVVPAELRGATEAACALMVGGRPSGIFALGREDDVREGRFLLEPLRPGHYRVWIRGEGDGWISEADVTVKSGSPTPLVMPVPSGSLVIPLEGAPAPLPSDTKVARLFRWEPYPGWKGPAKTDVAPLRVAIADGKLRLEGLLSGNLEATIFVPGFVALRIGPVPVLQGSESIASPLVLTRGRAVRVRLEASGDLKLLQPPSFMVFDPRAGEVIPVTQARQGAELLWTLSGFPDGTFTIRVDAGSGFLQPEAEVTIGEGGASEVTLRLERRRD